MTNEVKDLVDTILHSPIVALPGDDRLKARQEFISREIEKFYYGKIHYSVYRLLGLIDQLTSTAVGQYEASEIIKICLRDLRS